MSKVLIVDDDAEVCATLSRIMERMGHECALAHSLEKGLARLHSEDFDLVLLDVRLPDGNGLDALPEMKSRPGSPEIIILTGEGGPDGAELAIQRGVWDYLVKPSPIKQTMLSVERALKYREDKRCEKNPVALSLENVVGRDPKMKPIFDLVAQAAAAPANVLITGETGTGKELIARTIHANSPRAAKPFIVVDCASLPETLVESILFGHRKGAFTGADSDRPGLVKLAHGGTLFLDEVGELPLAMQRTFLRVLQEKTFRPVGASREEQSDFRLIAATNRSLEVMAGRGEFRQDLLFRLKTITLELPPLRERPQDIKPLALFHVHRLCEEYGLPPKGFEADFFEVLDDYDWPGNVRELFNILERAFVASGREKTLYAMHLPQDVRIKVTKANLEKGRKKNAAGEVRDLPAFLPLSPEEVPSGPSDEDRLAGSLKEAKERVEREYLARLLRESRGRVQKMMEVSELSRSHLYALLKKYGLSAED